MTAAVTVLLKLRRHETDKRNSVEHFSKKRRCYLLRSKQDDSVLFAVSTVSTRCCLEKKTKRNKNDCRMSSNHFIVIIDLISMHPNPLSLHNHRHFSKSPLSLHRSSHIPYSNLFAPSPPPNISIDPVF